MVAAGLEVDWGWEDWELFLVGGWLEWPGLVLVEVRLRWEVLMKG